MQNEGNILRREHQGDCLVKLSLCVLFPLFSILQDTCSVTRAILEFKNLHPMERSTGTAQFHFELRTNRCVALMHSLRRCVS